MTALVWYDKAGSDTRPWLVRKPSGEVVRAAMVRMIGDVRTAFEPEGFRELPQGPRGVVWCEDVYCQDEEVWV